MTTNDLRKTTLATLAGLAAYAPATSELLRWIGLQRRESRLNSIAYGAACFGAGVAMGGAAALLLTPQTGPEMRRRLRTQAQRAKDYVASEQGGTPDESYSPQH